MHTLKAKIKDLEAKIEVLVIAIPKEEEAFEFYTELKNQYEDQAAKEMFDYLAKQEIQHKRNLEGILKNLEDKLEKVKEERRKQKAGG